MSTSSDASHKTLEPLERLLHSIVTRLEAIESKVGLETPQPSVRADDDADAPSVSPALVTYDAFLAKNIVPLLDTCTKLAVDDGKMKEIGERTQAAFESIRNIILLASLCQKPATTTAGIQTALAPHIKQIQEAVGSIHKIRTTRDYDFHQKTIVEMLSSLSWVVMIPPPQTPSSYISETLSAAEFWSNKIRNKFKGVEGKEIHITFCDCVKFTIQNLAGYTKEYHALGLAWNPKGFKTLEEGANVLNSSTTVAANGDTASAAADTVVKSQCKQAAGGMAALVNELTSKRTTDGSSAATGLRKVTKEQQTWRKEFNPNEVSVPAPVSKVQTNSFSGTKEATSSASKSPTLNFDSNAQTWRVEYQTDKSNTFLATDGGLLKVKVRDVKEQVYIYQCQNITVEITGKCKTIVVDGCSKVNVVFGAAISSCEVVNSKRIQVQTLGVCPTFAIDKTDGCLIYLSKETTSESSFVTSKSSEMNVCFWPDGSEEMKELPIPEQFQHKIINASIATTVSDLYH